MKEVEAAAGNARFNSFQLRSLEKVQKEACFHALTATQRQILIQ